MEAKRADAAERTLEVLASAWQAGSRKAETLVGVCGEEKEGIPAPERRRRAHPGLGPTPAVTA